MLDDLKYIHDRDAQDALGVAERQWQQLSYEVDVEQPLLAVDNIVYAGMGSSAWAALFSQSWPGHRKPFEVVRDYDLPGYVSERTYFIAASYSGDSEETISALQRAEAAGAQIAIIAGGGELADIARQKGYPLAVLPKLAQPGYGGLANLKALIFLLGKAGVLPHAERINAELAAGAEFMETAITAWLPTVPTQNNGAKQIALEAIGKSIVIYAGPWLGPVAYNWKTGFNQNAKQLAWTSQYPEFNHNEFIGWTEQPVDKPYTVIDLRSNFDDRRVQQRFELSERLLSGRRPIPIIVHADGQTILQQLLWTYALGNFVTIYTALANGINPASSALDEKFKKALDE